MRKKDFRRSKEGLAFGAVMIVLAFVLLKIAEYFGWIDSYY